MNQSAYELLGGRRNDEGNNILKSPHLINVKDGIATLESEPYDAAFETNTHENTWESYDKLERTMRRRRKKLFKVLGTERIDVTVYDDWEMIGSFTIIKE